MSDPSQFRRLDETQIIQTLTRLRDRVAERFPDSGLRGVTNELLVLAGEASECVAGLQRPNWPIRVAVGAAIALMVGVLGLAAYTLRVPSHVNGITHLVQGLEAAINDLIFLGAAIFFLADARGPPQAA